MISCGRIFHLVHHLWYNFSPLIKIKEGSKIPFNDVITKINIGSHKFLALDKFMTLLVSMLFMS